MPEIASLFGVSIDALFSEEVPDYSDIQSFMKDDGVIRVIQMRGTKVLKVSSTFSQDEPPIEIAFPHDCNDRTQYFKVEVYGHVIAANEINGDVVCRQSIQSHCINGDVKCDGDIKVNELNAQKVVCKNINDCYKMHVENVEASGNITAVNITYGHLKYN